jgi:hypothetical protein
MSITPDSFGPVPPFPGPAPGVPWHVRVSRVFVSPATAFEGMQGGGSWWIPLLIVVLLEVLLGLVCYHRVMAPDSLARMEQQVTAGQMPPESYERAQMFVESNTGMAFTLGIIAVAIPIIYLLQALVVWFGTGFVLGAKFRFSQALGVVAWSGLVGIPGSLVRYAYGWSQETLKGLHLGLGVLLPEPETPTKLLTGLTVFLDAISPFTAWYLFVLVLGTAALAHMPRRNVAWVLVTLYLAFVAFSAAVAALFSQGA